MFVGEEGIVAKTFMVTVSNQFNFSLVGHREMLVALNFKTYSFGYSHLIPKNEDARPRTIEHAKAREELPYFATYPILHNHHHTYIQYPTSKEPKRWKCDHSKLNFPH